MFDWLKEILSEIWHYLLPFYVVNEYERGIRLRLGKNPTVLDAGFHWKIPLADNIMTVIVTTDTLQTHAVHITTTDEKTATVSPVIEYTVEEPIGFVIYTNEAHSNLHDIVRGEVADYLTDCSWNECKDKKTLTQIKNKINSKVKEMGVKVHRVMLADMCLSRVIITQI